MMTTKRIPCPNCRSQNVRWRKRRWYDGPLNFIETMLSGANVMHTNDGISPMQHSYMDPAFMRNKAIQEHRRKMGRPTAELFWKCPDCHSKGEAFQDDLH